MSGVSTTIPVRIRPPGVDTYIRQGARPAARASPAHDQLAQLDRVELTVHAGLGIRKEKLAGTPISVLSVDEQRESQRRGHEGIARGQK